MTRKSAAVFAGLLSRKKMKHPLLQVVALLLVASSLVSCRKDVVCPPTEMVFPCTCKHVAYGVAVTCANIVDERSLFNTFRRLSRYHLDSLLVHGINISGTVSENVFMDMKVDSFQLENSRLVFLGPAFRGLENTLLQLQVRKCNEVNRLEMANLRNLQELCLSKNKRRVIQKSWLEDKMSKLQILRLDSNEIEVVEDEAFAQMKDLKEISMASNRISSVSRNMLPSPALKLTRIDISHNILRDLPTDIFTQMPSLEEVILSGNELTTIVAETWQSVWNQLRSVYLMENSIICDGRIQWIKEHNKPLLFEGKCAEPVEMEDKSLEEVLFSS